MTGIRFYVDKLYSGLVLGLLAVYLSFSLNSYIQRFESPPQDMVEMSGLQLETGIVGLAIGAALAALVAARHNRLGGHDLLISAARPALARVAIQFAAVAIPALTGWLIFIIVTTLRNGVSGQFLLGVLSVGLGALALSACVALGQIIGMWLPPAIAGPVAFVATYLFAAFCAIYGDNYWWQWLGPAFGDSITPRPNAIWLIGEYAWFSGLVMLLLGANAWLSMSPRKIPRVILIAGVLAALTGIVLLIVNGSDASSDVVSVVP